MSFGTDHAGMEEWLRYFLTALKKQKDLLTQRIERERALSTEQLPRIEAEILKLASDLDRLTVATFVAGTQANRNTVKKHLQALVRRGLLVRRGIGKGTWYSKQ